MDNSRLNLEEKIIKIFENSNEITKTRLFENILFQVPFEVLTKMYEAERSQVVGQKNLEI